MASKFAFDVVETIVRNALAEAYDNGVCEFGLREPKPSDVADQILEALGIDPSHEIPLP